MAQILVIEDNVTMREGIVQILSRIGHDVRAATGGKEGIALFQQNSPDFVITDLKMEDIQACIQYAIDVVQTEDIHIGR